MNALLVLAASAQQVAREGRAAGTLFVLVLAVLLVLVVRRVMKRR